MLFFFFFNDTATTEIYTLSLHDALPIFTACANSNSAVLQSVGRPLPEARARHGPGAPAPRPGRVALQRLGRASAGFDGRGRHALDRKSTRLNSSHANISYAVFCLKKKKT